VTEIAGEDLPPEAGLGMKVSTSPSVFLGLEPRIQAGLHQPRALHRKVVHRNEAAMQIGAIWLPRIIEDAVIGVIEDEVVSFDMDYRYPANIVPALGFA